MSKYELITIAMALTGILLTVVVQALYIAYKMGRFEEKLTAIEKKQDKHNNVIERTVAVEQSTKSAHNRLDDGEKQFERLFNVIDELKDYLMRGGAR
jgi:hypothetical protein